MTKAKTGVFLSMGRLPQIVGQAALAASVLAGGASLLNAGGAMAVPCSTAGTFDINSFVGTVVDPTAKCPIIPGASKLAVAVDYDPALLIGSGSYSYKIDIPNPIHPGGGWFDLVDLGVDVNGVGVYSVSVTKSIADSVTGNALGSITFTQTNAGSSKTAELDLLDYTYNHLTVTDTYSVTGSDVEIDKITNTFTQTPGPLPILGAGAAFGFSRKLRHRIKAARTA